MVAEQPPVGRALKDRCAGHGPIRSLLPAGVWMPREEVEGIQER